MTKVEGLPIRLAIKIKNYKAWDMALCEGYIIIGDDGRPRWTVGNNTLLAYFCGKLFCGDYGWKSRRVGRTLWKKGTGRFPGKELNELFGLTTLKETRFRRENRTLPVGFEMIDNLFVELNG